MIRVANFFYVALMGLSILALYHVSEQTRVARVALGSVERQIVQEHATTNVLEAEWERVAGPARIQALAQAKLGMNDSASVELSALELLPRRGDEAAPLNGSDVKQASAQVPTPQSDSAAPDRAAALPVAQVAARSGF